MPRVALDDGQAWPPPPAAGDRASAPGLLSLGLRAEAVDRVIERVRAGPLEPDLLAEAMLAATPRAGRPLGPSVRLAEPDMLPRDRE